ncbi:MAG: hypothetical protein ACREPR_27600 [Brasilonema sp.]
MLKLTRRRFGQLLIGSTAVAGLGYLSTKTSAQTSSAQNSSIIYGARLDRKAGGFVIQSLDLATKQIQDLTTVSTESDELLSSLSYVAAENKFLLTFNPSSTSTRENLSPRLVSVVPGQAQTSVFVSGVQKGQRLQSVLVTNDGSVVSLVQKKDKTSSTLANLDVKAAAINTINNIVLAVTDRFDNLAQSRLENIVQSKGIIYTTSLGLQGDTSLVQLDLTKGQVSQGVQLKIDGTVWNSGFSSLASASGDQIYALGAPRYITPYNLYSINVSTGVITLIQQWDVAKIATSAGTS